MILLFITCEAFSCFDICLLNILEAAMIDESLASKVRKINNRKLKEILNQQISEYIKD